MPTNTMEPRLIDAIQPIRSFALAATLYHLFQTGLFDAMRASNHRTVSDLAAQHGWDAARLEALLKYLRNEGFVNEDGGTFALSDKGRALGDFRPWYTMLIGGYGHTFLQMGDKLQQDAGWATRDIGQVSVGSCGISHYDTIPLTRSLMEHIPHPCQQLLDLGCGNGLYLVEFCTMFPEIEAWGIEPGEESYQAAVALVREHGLENRIHLRHGSAFDFLHSQTSYVPDFIVLGFVLHEILGQDGENAVINFFEQLTSRYPEIYIVVIEIDNQIDTPRIMQHNLALAFYNPYYLTQAFTCQRLETTDFWEHIFSRCGLEMVAKEYVDARIDSTGLAVGYLLRQQR